MRDEHNYFSFDLDGLPKFIWKKKIQLISLTSLLTIIYCFYLISLPNIYKSEALLITNGETPQSSSLSGISGLGLLGLKNNNSRIIEAEKVLLSFDFFSEFINEYDLKPSLLASMKWDKDSKAIIFNEDIYDPIKKKWLIRDDLTNIYMAPSDIEAYAAFHDIFFIKIDSNFLYLSVEHLSPVFAYELLDKVIYKLNEYFKFNDVLRAEKSITYLSNKLNQSELTEVREVLASLIKQHTQTVLLSEVQDDYLFRKINSPIIPEQKIRPNRMLMAIFGAIFFFITSFFVMYFLDQKSYKD